MINAALCQSKTNPGAGRMPEAGHGAWHAASSAGLRCAGRWETPGGSLWESPAGWARGQQDGGCSVRGCRVQAQRVQELQLPPVPLGEMLQRLSPAEPHQPVRPAWRPKPNHPGAGLFSVSSCGFLPACAQENVSATPERPRGPSAIPAGLT